MYRYTYYRLVEKVDKEIGKIIDAIDKNDLWKNTVVIFSSDHGDGIGAHHWNPARRMQAKYYLSLSVTV